MIWKSIGLLVAAILTLASIETANPGVAGSTESAESTSESDVVALESDFLEGNAAHGRELFLQGNVACRACHSL